MAQVSAGETLCAQGTKPETYIFGKMRNRHSDWSYIILGEAYYDEAVLPFYKALKVYPAPMELVMIYQKTVPERVFQTIVNILAIEVMLLFFAEKGIHCY